MHMPHSRCKNLAHSGEAAPAVVNNERTEGTTVYVDNKLIVFELLLLLMLLE